MAEMHTGGSVVSLDQIMESAVAFGLNMEEVWHTVDDALYSAASSADPDCLEELTAALARSILAKQRRIAATEPIL